MSGTVLIHGSVLWVLRSTAEIESLSEFLLPIILKEEVNYTRHAFAWEMENTVFDSLLQDKGCGL